MNAVEYSVSICMYTVYKGTAVFQVECSVCTLCIRVLQVECCVYGLIKVKVMYTWH